MWGAVFVGFGGMIGALSRHGMISVARVLNPGLFPWGTLFVNGLGCLLAGLIAGYLQTREFSLSRELQLLLITGFCGGFTTFSAFGLDTLALFKAEGLTQTLFYVGGTLLISLLMTALGYQLAQV